MPPPAGRVPAVEEQDDLAELLRAANFLTLTECVQTVVARVAASMQPVRLRPSFDACQHCC